MLRKKFKINVLKNRFKIKIKNISKSTTKVLSSPGFALPVSYLLFLLVVAFIFFLMGECFVLGLETLVARLEEKANLLSTMEVQQIRLEELRNESSQLKDEKIKSLAKLRELKQKIAILEEMKNSASKK